MSTKVNLYEYEWFPLAMTSATTPYPYVITASSSFGAEPAYRAFDGVVGGNNRWISNNTTSAHITVDFGEKRVFNILKYTCASMTETAYPKSITIKGSNDGTTFVDIYSFNGTNITSSYQTFEFDNNIAYKFYRFHISSNFGQTYTGLVELVYGTLKIPTNKTFILHDGEYKKFTDDTHYIMNDTKANPINANYFRYYPLAQTTGTSAESNKNNVIGTVMGSPTWQGSNGIKFNGLDSYIAFQKRIIPIGAKSIFFKIKIDNFNNNAQAILNEGHSAINHGTILNIGSLGNISFGSQKGSATEVRFSGQSNKKVVDGQWHHVMLTWDGTTNANGVKLYIDDLIVPDKVLTASATETVEGSFNTVVGKSAGADLLYSTANIKDLEIYNMALTFKSHEEVYDFYIEKQWEDVSDVLPNSTQFTEQGMDSLSTLLERKVIDLEPLPMTNKIEILDANDIGKVFSKTIDLKKYFDIRSIRTEVR